jgi:hypothetical protein
MHAPAYCNDPVGPVLVQGGTDQVVADEFEGENQPDHYEPGFGFEHAGVEAGVEGADYVEEEMADLLGGEGVVSGVVRTLGSGGQELEEGDRGVGSW